MEIWQSDAACVRALKTFRAMPWPYKALDVSMILSPILVTLIAYLGLDDEPLEYFWEAIAVLYWLVYARYVLAFVRGYYAERKGIVAAAPETEPEFGQGRGTMITFVIVTVVWEGFSILVWMHAPHSIKRRDSSSIALPLVFLFQQASRYARNRFWNISFQ